MASTVLFVIMAIIAGVLLLLASLTSTIGAIDAFGSQYYNTDSKIRAGHQYLTIAAALGWSALVVLIVIMIVAAVAGGFSKVEVSDALLNSTTPSKSDLIAAYKGEKELSSGHTTQIIVLIVLILVALVSLVVGILAVLAAINLGGVTTKDSKSSSAYTQAIIAAVAGVGGIGIMVVAIISYVSIRSARKKQLEKTNEFIEEAEAKLGVTKKQ